MQKIALVAVVAFVSVLAACPDNHLVDLAGGVAGQVCDPLTGRKAGGAVVTAHFINAASKKPDTKNATADENGFYRLGGLPTQTLSLHVEKADQFQDDISNVVVNANKDTQLQDPACRDLPPDPGHGSIVGQICNRHTGDYITAGTVSVELPDGTQLNTTTDSEGRFQLDDVPVGDQIVYVRGAGFQKTFRVSVTDTSNGGPPTELDSEGITCTPYDPQTTGFITGTVCADDGTGSVGPLAGAHVFVVTNIDGSTYDDETIDDGSFIIAGIPTTPTPPALQVRVEKGGFSFTWDDVIVHSVAAAPDGTNLTASIGCQALQPDDGRKYLVVEGTFDRIEDTLGRMGITPDLVDGNPITPGADWTQDAFGVKETLESYDAVFVNCGIDEGPLLPSLNATVKANLKSYVQGGGALYVSDWSYDLIEAVWPEEIDFLGNDLENSSAEYGAGEQTYHARVLEPGLQQYLGSDELDVDFAFDNFAVVSQVAAGVTTYLQADEKWHVNNTEETLTNTPMTVGFSDGLGRVIFTSFHQEQNAAAACSASSPCDAGFDCNNGACVGQLDGPEDNVLRYLIFSL
ncbi:MAG TPA: carboxypeptidase regulatory-like domain-containing protein [Myxococcota bacterium]|jgi:hypothetical protein